MSRLRIQTNSKRIEESNVTGSTSEKIYGKVLDVVISKNNPYYKTSQDLYGVHYKVLGGKGIYVDSFAYCDSVSFRRIPFPGEIVEIEERPCVDDSNVVEVKPYWISIVSVWNTPTSNLCLDSETIEFSKYDIGGIKPLKLGFGETSVEGSEGQSIHMLDKQLKIRVGQKNTEEIFSEEDINEDGASIYLLSGATDLEESSNKHCKEVSIITGVDYEGTTLAENADRVIINSKKDNIQISSLKSTSISAKDSVIVDGEKDIAFDAEKIYLGKKAQTESQPALRGEKTTQVLKDLISRIVDLLEALQTVAAPAEVWQAAVSAEAAVLVPMFNSLKIKLEELKSDKIFVE